MNTQKNTSKRIVLCGMALLIMILLLPVLLFETEASYTGTLSDPNIEVYDEGDAAWTLSGTSITGTVTGTKTTSGCSSSNVSRNGTLTLTSTYAATLKFSWKLEGGGTVTLNKEVQNKVTQAEVSQSLAAGGKYTIKVESQAGEGKTSTLTITGIELIPEANYYYTTFKAPEHGSYTVYASDDGSTTDIKSETTEHKIYSNVYTLTATAKNGYSFFGWLDGNGKVISRENPHNVSPQSDTTISPLFIVKDSAVWSNGGKIYTTWDSAMSAAKNGSDKTVVLLNDAILSSGNYTIPSGVTLLIPYNDANTCLTNTNVADLGHAGTFRRPVPNPLPDGWENLTENDSRLFDSSGKQIYFFTYAYRTLEMAPGANMIVEGAISVGSQHSSGGSDGNCGVPVGPYGHIKMSTNSSITVKKGGVLYTWGYITGDGEVHIQDGGTVYEMFQIMDFRGGTITTYMVMPDNTLIVTVLNGLKDGDGKGNEYKTYKILPFSQYYVQNVEVKMTLYSGAKEMIFGNVNISDSPNAMEVEFIGGENALFNIGDGARVTKKYDPSTDRIILSTEGEKPDSTITVSGLNVSFSFMSMDFPINTRDYVLPLTNNMTININSGTIRVPYDVAALPGCEMTVAKNATIVVEETANLFIYDLDQWKGVYNGQEYYFVGSTNQPFCPLFYTPTREVNRTLEDDIKDVIVTIDGYAKIAGNVYTTLGGAQIISTGTGIVDFMHEAGTKEVTYQYIQTDPYRVASYTALPIKNAWLMNGDNTYSETGPLIDAHKGGIFFYDNGKWSLYTTVSYNANKGEGTMDPDLIDNWDIYEAYLLDENGNLANKDVDGDGYLISKIPYLFTPAECKFTRSGYTFLGWSIDPNATEPDASFKIVEDTVLYAVWKANTYEVTWNVDGNTYTTTSQTYDAQLVLPTAPSKTGYTFKGWFTQENGGEEVDAKTIYQNASETTYYAQWEINQYTITWIVNGNTTTETYNYGQMPAFKGSTDKAKVGCTTYTFIGWDKEIASVTGDVTYTARYNEGVEHNLKTIEGKDPTCTEIGWNEYVICQREGCGYSTYVETPALNHVDENKDHVCDRGCGKSDVGDHNDANKDHVCDYGCKVAIGVCEDTSRDHYCDYGAESENGCRAYFGEHKDADKDHGCDYGCEVAIGVCEDINKDHYCDYGAESENGCRAYFGDHNDANKDHACDYGCELVIGVCEDTNQDHYCDYGAESENGCRAYFGDHKDANDDEDHVCDYGCGAVLETCSDENGDKDHNCDVCGKENVTAHTYSDATCEAPRTCSECGGTAGVALGHIDENTDHVCDRNCGKADMGEHSDTNHDHACEYGCKEAIGTCDDTDKDHKCDYGCSKVYGEHKDADKNHKCDYGCSVENFGEHKDGDNDHDCDYCGVVEFGEHVDANKDHVCDYGCKVAIGTCADANADHYCDYGAESETGCRNRFGQHQDAKDDKDHVCDYCGGEIENGETCTDVKNDNNHDCDVCGAKNVTAHEYGVADYIWSEDGKTCTASRNCNCGDTQTTEAEIISAEKTPATCTEMGITTYTAKFTVDWASTQTKDVVDIPAKGHEYDAVVTNPTCTADGYTTHTCAVCRDTYTDAKTDATGHSYNAVVTAPTCTVGGYTTHTCSVCGDTYTDTATSATGHTYGEIAFSWNADNTECTASHVCHCGHSESVKAESSSEITTVATCTAKQVTTYTAVFAAEWIDETVQTQTKQVEGDKAPDNHTQACVYSDNMDGKHTKTYPCCGMALTEGHTYTAGNCVCGKVQIFTITWVNGNSTKTTSVEYGQVPVAPYGDNEYAKTPDISYHYAFAGWSDTVTGTAFETLHQAFADVTYYAVYSGVGHDYTQNCKVCSVCNYSGDSSRAHTVGNPTCTEDAICAVCHLVVTPAYGHLYTYNTNLCYWSTDENGNHVYHFVASCTREDNCHVTDEVIVIAVQQAEGYKAPTCTADGSANYIAKMPSNVEQSWAQALVYNGYGEVSEVFAIAALGHDLTETVVQAATCTETGTLGYWTCGRCSGVFEDAEATVPTTAEARKINPLGHDWKCTEDGTIICSRDVCDATTTDYIETAHTWVSESATAATCTTPGEHAGRHCSVCGKEEGGGTIAALGHSYGATYYTWVQTAEAGRWICMATHSCTREGCNDIAEGHTETAFAEVTAEISIPSSCTVKGTTKYTAKFDVNWAREQVKTEQDVPVVPHTPDAGIITKSPFYNTEGERTYHCTVCGEQTGTAVEPATGVINISVLGDSITAFENYSNGVAANTANSTLAGGRVWFPMTEREYDSEGNPINKGTGEITEAEHIWIYKAAQSLGANILVNNSWSGSAVKFWQYGAPGMWEDRAVQLHDNTGDNNGQEPDIIVVYMGTNDFKYTELVNGTYAKLEDGSYYQSVLGSYEDVNFATLITDNGDGTFTYAEPQNTMEAYAISFHKMQQRYPNSEIYVMNILPFRAGIHQPTEFNEDIRQMVEHLGVHLVDIEDIGIEADEKSFEYLMEDWLHPNIKGMEVLANAFESAVRNNSALYADDHVNITYNDMTGVTAMEGTTRTVVVGEAFDANLKLKDTSLIMQVTVIRNGVDITDTCVTEVDDPKFDGKMVNIHIDNVAENDVIVITAKAHKHTYTDAVTAPTCTEGGYTTYTCECGDSYQANEVSALGHSYTLLSTQLAKEATCVDNEEYYVMCERCADVHETETFAKENTKLGHSFTTKPSSEVYSEATCTDPARCKVQCDRCDVVSADKTVAVGDALGHSFAAATPSWQYDAANSIWICTAKRVCSRDGSHIETATATVTGEKTTAPTCTEKGWTTYTATFDVEWVEKQTKKVEDIAAKGHAYGETVYEWTNGNLNCTAKHVCGNDARHIETVEANVKSVVKTPATCTEKGWTKYTATFVLNWAEEQTTEAEDIAAKGHTEEEIPAVPATCTDTGLAAGVKCSVCDDILVEQETVAALGHSMSFTAAEEATCTATGNNEYYTCEICGKVFEDEAGENETTVAQMTIAALGHSMIFTAAEEATCTATGNNAYYTCETCDKVFTDEAGENETTVAQMTIAATGHDIATVAPQAATCTQIGWNAYEYCQKCDYTTYSEIDALGHNTTLTEAKSETCTAAGNNAYYTCDRCNGVFKDASGNQATTVAAETIPAIGHKYNEGEVTIEPTCTGQGEKTFTCKNDASHTYTENIDPLGHALEKVKAKAATCTEAGYEEHYKCSRDNCGVLFLDAAGATTTTEAALVVDAKGHTRETIPAVPATCTDTGLTAGVKCSVCNEILEEQEIVDALGHQDADSNHICDNGCDVYQGTHTDGDDKDHLCDYCQGAVEGDICVDSDKNHKCDECEEVISTCADEDSNHECDYEGCKAEMGEHKSNAAYPCLAGRCDYCSVDMPATAEHQPNADDNDCTTAINCSICGTETTAAKPHFDGDDKNHDCDYCDAKNVDDGCYGGVATCMAAAICDECGLAHGEVDSMNHTRNNTYIVGYKDATVDAPGYTGDIYCECHERIAQGAVIEQLQGKLVVDKLDAVPDVLKDRYDTVEELEDALSAGAVEEYQDVLEGAGLSNEDVKSELYDVVLYYVDSVTNALVKADDEHFPEDGMIEVILPIPEGTNHEQYTYFVSHIFTSTAFNRTVGDFEYPEVTEFVQDGKEYIKFTVTGLSPIVVTYAHTDACDWVEDGYAITATQHSKTYKCSIPGCDKTMSDAAEDHTGGSASCVEKAVCLVCHVAYGECLPHSYAGEIKNDGNGKEGTHSYKCVNGCNEYGAAEKHTWNEGVVTTEPDCLTAGEKTYTCTVGNCGAIYTEVVDATGHNFGETTTANAATCLTSGNEAYKQCSECNLYFAADAAVDSAEGLADNSSFILNATGHNFGETTAANAATCLTSGNEAYKQCSECNLYFAADAAVDSAEGNESAEAFTIDQLDHSYTDEIKNDGNGKEGTHSYKCINGCNEYGAAVQHTWNEGAVTTNPDCLTAGEKTYTCTTENCGARHVENLGKDSTNHVGTMIAVGAVEATCGVDGYTGDLYCECGRCVAIGEIIPATGLHNYVADAAKWNEDKTACTVNGVCDVCQETITANATITSEVCTEATCVTEVVTTYTAVFTESWIDEQNVAITVIGDKDVKKHMGNTTVRNAVDATCGAAGYTGDTYCECGEKIGSGTVIDATGEHQYTEEVSRTAATCMATGSVTTKCACGVEMTETLPVDAENHVDERIFESLGDEVHKVTCACGHVISSSENHTFDPDDNECVCGEVMSKTTSKTVVVALILGVSVASGAAFYFVYLKRRRSQK